MLLNSFIMLAGLGLAAAIMLTLASKAFYVKEDPKIAAVSEALPGANCGGCGFAGCDGYAAAVVTDPAVPANMCCVGGPDLVPVIGRLTGKDAGSSEPTRAFRRCERNEGKVEKRYIYEGMDNCTAAARLNRGTEACEYACLGFGDCVEACPFHALVMRDGMPLVLTVNCTSCGKCVKTCPRNIMTIIPLRARVMIHCSTKDKLKAVSDVCGVGCIKCMKCVKSCPAGAVALENDYIVIDHAKCLEYGPSCREVCVTGCPRKILRYLCVPPAEAAKLPEEELPPPPPPGPEAGTCVDVPGVPRG